MLNISIQSIAVIGGYGFLGTHICKSLLKQNKFNNIYVIGRNKIKHFELVDNSFIRRECKHKDMDIILSTIDVVVYLAWNSTPFSSTYKKRSDDNLSVLKTYLDLIAESDIYKFIFISSAGGLYKSPDSVVFSEDTACLLDSPYAVEKQNAENLILSSLNKKSQVYLLRPSNIFGPGQRFKLGMGLIPKLFDCARDMESIILYEPLASERDYLYISDFVSVLNLFMLENIDQGIYNLSFGSNISLAVLIEKIEKLVRKKINIILDIKKPANRAIISANKIHTISQWKPEVDFSKGILLTKIGAEL